MNEDPKTQTPDEAFLASLDTDLNPTSPDATGEPPAREEFEINEDLLPPEIEDVREALEAPPAEEEEVADETELLKQLTDGRYESVDDLVTDYKGKAQQVEQLGELLRKAGYDVSDNPIQDLMDALEQQLVSQQPGFLTGAQPPAQVVPPSGGAQPLQAPQPPRPGEGSFYNTANFIAKYPQLKWTPDFIKELTSVLGEHMNIEAPKVDGFITHKEMESVANVNKRLFRDQMVTDHIMARLNSGEKLPRNYRAQLTAAIEKNPVPMERAWRGYIIRGYYNGVVDDYARTIQAERDPNTGLSRAETNAQATEAAKAASNKRVITGGSPPQVAGKKSAPTVRDLEKDIEAVGRKLL